MIEGEKMKNDNKKIARLIKQIQRGNQSAFEEFYKQTSPGAYFVALKITQNEHDAEDILQESYIKVLEKINEIDVSQNINSWFLKIVANKSKDLLKSKNRFVFEDEENGEILDIPEENTEFCPEESLNQEELRLEVMAAIDELTAEKRACIMMMYFGDMSVKEIAESIEVTESTVKNRLYYARKELRTKFEKNGNILYSAALGGVLAWALTKTSVTASAAFLVSAASAEIIAGATAASTAGAGATAAGATAATTAAASSAAATTSATATAAATTAAAASTGAAASTAAATGAGVAAKIAALSIAQKVVVGTVAAGVIGGSTAGVATVAKNIVSPPSETTTAYIVEEVTTAPSQTRNSLLAWLDRDNDETQTQTEASEKPTTEATTRRREPTGTFPIEEETEIYEEETESETEPETEEETEEVRTKAPSTRRDYSLNRTTSKAATTKKVTTTAAKTTVATTAEETTEVETTEEETTTKKAVTTRVTTTKKVTTTKAVTTTKKPSTTAVPTTAKPTTTAAPTTTQPPTTAEPTTQAPATLIIEVTDFENNVVATITEKVEAGTEISRDYLVSLVSSKGYEAMAGVYGDAIGKVAQAGQTYSFTAEL